MNRNHSFKLISAVLFVFSATFIINLDGVANSKQRQSYLSPFVVQTRNETKSKSFFDQAQDILYTKAVKPVINSERKNFTLEGWERGSGGLQDSDRLLLGELYYNAQSVFEFGLGESTKIASYVGVPRYAGVDNDPVWVSKARNTALDHFRFTFADVGPSGAWGYPNDPSLQKNQFNYQFAPLIVERDPFDVYLVDGRYRLGCACAALLHAFSRGGDMSRVRVGIHDSYRPYAKEFLKVTDLEKKSDMLNVYKLKDGVTEEDVFNLWKQVADQLQR